MNGNILFAVNVIGWFVSPQNWQQDPYVVACQDGTPVTTTTSQTTTGSSSTSTSSPGTI